MSRADVQSDSSIAVSLEMQAYTETTEGETVDLLGYNAAQVIYGFGAITDGKFIITIEDSEDEDVWATVGAAARHGSYPSEAAATAWYKIGYGGGKRYIRAKVTVSEEPETGGLLCAAVIRSDPQYRPLPA